MQMPREYMPSNATLARVALGQAAQLKQLAELEQTGLGLTRT